MDFSFRLSYFSRSGPLKDEQLDEVNPEIGILRAQSHQRFGLELKKNIIFGNVFKFTIYLEFYSNFSKFGVPHLA